MMRVADWILNRLSDEGLRHIFLLPGGGAMHLNDALACQSRIQAVPCHHEQACAIAAEAYGRTGHTDNPGFGVAMVTTGPGATNAITAVAGAWIDSIPLLIISGQVKTSDCLSGRPLRQGGVQEVEVIPMVKGITKYASTVDDSQQVRNQLEQALLAMRTGRPGPVWLEVPLDIQATHINPDNLIYSLDLPQASTSVDTDQTSRVFDLLSRSERPLILAGHGIRLSGAADSFIQLVEKWQVPVVSTWNALDLLPHDHPLYVGSPGVVALRAPNFAVQNCDLLISIGCRLDNIITAYNPKNFAKSAFKVVVDIDADELNKHDIFVDEKVHGDAAHIIRTWLDVDELHCKDRSSWLLCCRNWKSRYTVNDGKALPVSDFISHYQLVDTLSSIIPEDTLIVTGSSGLAVEVFYSTFRSKHGQRVFLTSGLGSMGYGLPAAIGASLGNSNQPVVAIESDGSLMLNLQELATLKSLDLPITLIIMDNNGYASIRNTQRNYFDSRFIATGKESGLHIPNLESVVCSFGLNCSCIESYYDLYPILSSALNTSGPHICIVRLQPNESLMPKVSAIPQPDGSMISMPLEDMTPLLPLDELHSQMILPLDPNSLSAREKK